MADNPILARIMRLPDVSERMMIERLHRRGPIFKMSRFVKGGPICPAAVMWVLTRYEPGESSNEMDGTRSAFIAGFISGKPDDPVRVYASSGPSTRELTWREYEMSLNAIDRAAREGRYLPELEPFKPLRIDQIAIPFL